MVYDPRIPAREECVLRNLLDKWAVEIPDHVAFVFDDGKEWTWSETLYLTRRVAAGFLAAGVKQGDHVLSWQPNCKEAVLTWYGLSYIGAVYVPINTAYKGNLLQHVIELSNASLMICNSQFAPRLADIDLGEKLTDVILIGEMVELDGLKIDSFSDFMANEGKIDQEFQVEPWDSMYIIFTSGTTGPSKAVLSSYIHAYTTSLNGNGDTVQEDRILTNLPLFHVGGTVFLYLAAVRGCTTVLVDSFRTDEFLPIIRKHRITYTCLLAAMVPFLLRRPPDEGDKDHSPLRGIVIPWNEDAKAVTERYGFKMKVVFNMTEICSPLGSDYNPNAIGACGKPVSGIEVRVVDANDCEVAPGETGELIVRTDRPWAMNHGYYGNPEATAEAWRNGWFHTGDAFRYDEENNFYFVDRIKDAIRRRGENISSFEVESEVTAFPSVGEAAAIAVPSEFGEDDVMIVVAPATGQELDPTALFHFLEPRMAYFMLPRYIRIMPDLPKTPTQKVQKNLLKEAGITADTWDREAEGIKVKRESQR